MKEEENNENKYARREERRTIQLDKSNLNEKRINQNHFCC